MVTSIGLAAAQIPATGVATAATDQVRVELLADRKIVAAGERITIALRQTIRAGWHTYWQNPGDSGLPTQLNWVAPAGLNASGIDWPPPSRFMVGPLVNYGYANEVVLLVTIEVPASLRSGDTLALTVDANWLVCAEICIPEDARLALSIPVGAAGVASDDARLIERSREALPQPSPGRAKLAVDRDRMIMQIDAAGLDTSSLREAYFFAIDPGAVEHAAPQKVSITADSIVLDIKRGEATHAKAAVPLAGILSLRQKTDAGETTRSFSLTAVPGPITHRAATPLRDAAESLPIWQVLLFALFGGLILNFMPCVFPVLSMKAIALIAQSGSDRRVRRAEGIAYLTGVLVCFAGIAATLLGLRASGAELGWGFQFQSPIFVALLAFVMLAVGLNLSGVFAVELHAITNLGQARSRNAGMLGSFMSGLLAVIVATPCTAPFMGAALGVALSAAPFTMVAILFALGAGFALPFVAVTFIPGIARALPRPAAWMERLKQFLAFPMYATAAWLVWVASQQTSAEGFALVLGGLMLVAFAGWLFGSNQPRGGTWRKVLAALALALAVGLAIGITESSSPRVDGAKHPLGAEAYSAERLATLRGEGRIVFVNMTAAWCITCLFNERSTLAAATVRDAFAARHVAYLKGDWTQRDGAITNFLRSFQRSGVPLYVAYPGDGGFPIVLPQILTEAVVLAAIGTAP